MKDIKVLFLKETFAIAKVKDLTHEFINSLVSKSKFFSFCSDEDEKSLICEESYLPEFIECSKPWSAMKVVGPIPFDSWGILSKILEPIANLRCSVLAVSSFSTDYIFFQSEHDEIVKEVFSKITTIVL